MSVLVMIVLATLFFAIQRPNKPLSPIEFIVLAPAALVAFLVVMNTLQG